MIQVKRDAPANVTVTISGSRDELQALYDATRPGRRSRGQQALLVEFGDELAEAVPGIARVDTRTADEQLAEGPGDRPAD